MKKIIDKHIYLTSNIAQHLEIVAKNERRSQSSLVEEILREALIKREKSRLVGQIIDSVRQ
jgi:hypothetical protein